MLAFMIVPLALHLVITFGDALVAVSTLHEPLRVQLNDTLLAMNPYDLVAACLKHLVLGFFIGVVACQKGLGTSGGAEGVGRAVAHQLSARAPPQIVTKPAASNRNDRAGIA